MIRLIIAPHVDDDVIGCGGLLAAHGSQCVVAYLGVDDVHIIDRVARYKEAAAVAQAASFTFYWPRKAVDGKLFREEPELSPLAIGYHTQRIVNHYGEDFPSLIRDLEWLIGRVQPDEVYLPWPSYNQDHQAVYRAAMVALRPSDYLPFVNRVYLYEEPDCFWPGAGAPFTPTAFRAINVEAKLGLYALMASQVRPHRSLDMLKALAVVRGGHIMAPAAEAYHVLRMVE